LKQILIFFFITIFIFIAFPDNKRLVIQNEHEGTVNSLIYQNKYKVLLSGGEDGTVKIWNPVTRELYYNIQLSYLPIERLIVNPEKTHFTALIKTSLTSSKLICYDWINDKKNFELDLNEVPIYFTYSANGNYLIYLITEWDSIIVNNAITGQKLSLLKNGFGIVSFISTFADDKKIITYRPSGKIIFKELATGKDLLEKPVNTLENLKAISISSNSRFMAAQWNKDLVIIDILTGKSLASIEKPSILSTSIRTDGKEILCLYKKDNTNQFTRFSFNGKELVEILPINKITSYVTNCLYTNNTIYFSTGSGQIFQYSDNEEISRFTRDSLLKITDIAFNTDKVALGTNKHIILVNPDLLQSPHGKEITYTVYPNLFAKSIGLEFLDSIRLLVWNREDKPNKFYILDINTGNVINFSKEYSSQLLQIDINPLGIFTLEQNGQFKILNPDTLETIFKYTTSGMNKVIYISKNLLIAARNKIGQTGSSLMQINPETGETVPINSSSLMCYDLVYNSKNNLLYSLNISKDNAATSTILKVHYSDGFEKEKNLTVYPGEDLGASIVIDAAGKNLYSSIGYNSIEVYNGSSIINLAKSGAIPRKLYIGENILLSINKNSSTTIWNRLTGKIIMNLYLLNSEEINWIAQFNDEEYYTSENAKDYIKEFIKE